MDDDQPVGIRQLAAVLLDKRIRGDPRFDLIRSDNGIESFALKVVNDGRMTASSQLRGHRIRDRVAEAPGSGISEDD
jgi:hypothetical protein